jgi:hypothetical protein
MILSPKLDSCAFAILAGAILVGLGLISCNQKDDFTTSEKLDLKYLLIMRSGFMDTIHRKIEHWTKSDSFAIISYKERYKNDDPYETTYKFSMKRELDSLTHFRLLDTARFELDGKTYAIRKYLYDDINTDDEEMLYFYSPDFGILIFKSAWWGNYQRLLISDDTGKDRIIFYLIEMIANNDNDFFYNWCGECR